MLSKSLGCDPEVFLKHKLTGEFISSVGLVGGSKDFPMPIGKGCAVQEDNVTVEFNTPPCETVDQFISAINYNKEVIKEIADKHNLEICIQPSAVFSDEQLNTEAAQTFGCEPDYNAWNGGMQNPRPQADNKNLRSAGGHVHIALPDGVDRLLAIQCMDLYVGCLMLEFDTDTDRRLLYGKPGAFRVKSYGVEYRTASNMWIEDDTKIRWVWDQTDKAVARAATGAQFTSEQGQMIQDCINNSDMNLLAHLKAEFGL